VAKTTQKLVLSLDTETQTFKPAGHNFSPEQAVEQTQRLQGAGSTAVIVDQERHHRALSFHQCKPCKKAAEDATSKQTQPSDQQQVEHDSAASSEDESESE
jgi:hypothetical protein